MLKEGDQKKAEDTINKMKSLGLKPDIRVLSSLMKLYGKEVITPRSSQIIAEKTTKNGDHSEIYL